MESLSDYMLLEVFTRLDPESLRNCTEVCKRWNNLISQSTSTMSNFTLNVNDSCKLLRHVNRRYFNMKLFKMTIGPKTWSLLLNYQQSLCKLELIQIAMTESNYVKILQSVSTLEELAVIHCSLRSRRNGVDLPVQMPLLHNLTIWNSNGFLDNIDGGGLEKIELNQIDITESNYMQMLQNASTLQELTIVGCFLLSRNDREGELVQMPMLKNLTINNSSGFLDNIEGSALKKLEFNSNHLPSSFVSSLEKLEDLTVTSCNGNVYDSFASAKVELKKLKIDLLWIWGGRSIACTLIKAHTSTLETLEIESHYHPEAIDYDLANVAPDNSLSTQSFDDYYHRLISISPLRDSHEMIASTAKYYFPQLKSMKIYCPRSP